MSQAISVNDILGETSEAGETIRLGGLPDGATGVHWTDTDWTECRFHLLHWSWAEAVTRSDEPLGIILTGPIVCDACRETGYGQ